MTMNKILRVHTSPSWLTKPVADTPDNRLTADEVDGNLLYLMTAGQDVTLEAGSEYLDPAEVTLRPTTEVSSAVWTKVETDTVSPDGALQLLHTQSHDLGDDRLYTLTVEGTSAGRVLMAGAPRLWPSASNSPGVRVYDTNGNFLDSSMVNFWCYLTACDTGDYVCVYGTYPNNVYRFEIYSASFTLKAFSQNTGSSTWPEVRGIANKWGNTAYLVFVFYENFTTSFKFIVYETSGFTTYREQFVDDATGTGDGRTGVVHFSQDNNVLAIGRNLAGKVILWDTSDADPNNWTFMGSLMVPPEAEPHNSVWHAQFMPDSTTILVEFYEYTGFSEVMPAYVVAYDVATQAVVSFPMFNSYVVANKTMLGEYSHDQQYVVCYNLSRDGGATFFTALLNVSDLTIYDNAATSDLGILNSVGFVQQSQVTLDDDPYKWVQAGVAPKLIEQINRNTPWSTSYGDSYNILGNFGGLLTDLYNYQPLAGYQWFYRKVPDTLAGYIGKYASIEGPAWTTKGAALTPEEADRSLVAAYAQVQLGLEVEPVGSMCLFALPVVLPPEYLPADGGVYNEVDYPELYAVLGGTGGTFTVPLESAPEPMLKYAIRAL